MLVITVITEDKICCETIDLFMHVDNTKFSREFKWFLSYVKQNFHILPLKSVIPNFVAFGIPRNGIFFQ